MLFENSAQTPITCLAVHEYLNTKNKPTINMYNANLKRRMLTQNSPNSSPPTIAKQIHYTANNLQTIQEDNHLKSPIRKYITPKKQRTINGDRCKL
jgi:hypothetical protein